MHEEERQRALAFAKTRNGKLTEAIVEGMGEVIGPVIKELQRRVAALEARPGVKYLGVYDQTKEYEAGSMVTDDGSMWHANLKVKGIRPGDGSCWTLAVKRGRNAKDSPR